MIRFKFLEDIMNFYFGRYHTFQMDYGNKLQHTGTVR